VLKILVDITHPAHVHFFKQAIRDWQARGHQVIITSRDKDLTLRLLDRYGFHHTMLSQAHKGIVGLGAEMLERGRGLWKIVQDERPMVLTGIGGTFIAPIGKLTGTPVVVFTDTEHATVSNAIAFPLADAICTPTCYKGDLGKKQVRYRGYQELAYLHPKYFKADPAVLNALNLTLQDRFAILRFVSWNASHDIGHIGFTVEQKMHLIYELEQEGQVLVSVEGSLPEELERYRLSVAPEKIHDLLYYASLYVGEGATMATEAGLLGTPSVYVSSLVGTMGNYEELARHGLVEAYRESHRGMKRAIVLMRDMNAKRERQEAHRRMLREVIDVTAWMVDFVEQYVQAISGEDVSK